MNNVSISNCGPKAQMSRTPTPKKMLLMPTCPAMKWKPAKLNMCVPCLCSPKGSYSKSCNKKTGQCFCKEHWSGPLCDKCDLDGSSCERYGGLATQTFMADSARNTVSNSSLIIRQGHLGEECLQRSDCVTENTLCLKNRCSCKDGYEEVVVKNMCRKRMISPCSYFPCAAGSTCELDKF